MVKVAEKQVKDRLIASIRFRGYRKDVAGHLVTLREAVEPYICGNALSLLYGGHPDDGFEIEVAYPVSQAVETGEVESRTLPGGAMLCLTHVGAYTPMSAGEGLMEGWKRLWDHLREHEIPAASGPGREIYLEGPERHGDAGERYVTEIQWPLLLPVWLERLSQGLDRHAGEAVRRQVMQGYEELPALAETGERVAWLQGAIDRLDGVVADKETRKNALVGCAHRFPAWRIEKLRAAYQQLGSVDALLKYMRQDPTWDGSPFYRRKRDSTNTVYIAKVPWDADGCRAACSGQERRAAYCHCNLIREAIRSGERLSPTFCYCGAGWYVQLWSGILGQPVQVDILETILQGGDCCKFAIHLPPGT